MPLENEQQAKTVVRLIDRIYGQVREGIITPENIENELNKFISRDEIGNIPSKILKQVCRFILLLSQNGIPSLHQLLQSVDHHQEFITSRYIEFVEKYFDSDVEMLVDFADFVSKAWSTPLSATPTKHTPTELTVNESVASPEEPEKEAIEIPANLQRSLDSLANQLKEFKYTPNSKVVQKTPESKRKLSALIQFFTEQEVNNISFEKINDIDKLNSYLDGLKKLAALCIQLLPPQENQRVGNCNQNLQTKVSEQIKRLTPVEEKPAQADENKPYLILKYYREKGRSQEIHDVDSHGHLLLVVNYFDEQIKQYKKVEITLRAYKDRNSKEKILEERNPPVEVQIHKLFSSANIPSGNIIAGYFPSEEEITRIEQRQSGRVTVTKEIRLDQEGIDYQAIGKRASQYLRDHPKASVEPFRYCFYRSNDAHNCASLIYELLELGHADKYAKLKKEWGHVTPKNVFNFGKDVGITLHRLTLLKASMQTQADKVEAAVNKACASYADEFGLQSIDEINEYKNYLDARQYSNLPFLPELNGHNPSQIAIIIKQLYLFAHALKNPSDSDIKNLKERIVAYLENAQKVLFEIKTANPSKQKFFEDFEKLLIHLQKIVSHERRVFPLLASISLARIEIETKLKNLTQNSAGEPTSMMSSVMTPPVASGRPNLPVAPVVGENSGVSAAPVAGYPSAPTGQVADYRVFAAAMSPIPRESHAGDEHAQQANNVLKFINTKIHINPELLGNQEITSKYRQIMQIINNFNIVNETKLDEDNLRNNLFAASMNIQSAILQIRELQNTSIKSIPNSFYELVIKQMQTVVGEINRLIYFELDMVTNPANSNLNLTSELSVLLGQDAAPLNDVDDVLKQAETSIASKLPPNEPVTAKLARNIHDVVVPDRHWYDRFNFLDFDANWYAEVSTRKAVADVLENKKYSAKEQQRKISKIISAAKPSVLKFWRWSEYDRYAELERKAEVICLTKSFIQGESDEVGLLADLLSHFKDYPESARIPSQIGNMGDQVQNAPLLENLFSQYSKNIASLVVNTSQGNSYSLIESILRGNKTTPKHIPESEDIFDWTLSSVRHSLQKKVNIDLAQPDLALRVAQEQVAQELKRNHLKL